MVTCPIEHVPEFRHEIAQEHLDEQIDQGKK